MDINVREMDVCFHLPTRRRCLVIAVGADEVARCVTTADEYFDCRTGDLIPYRHPRYSEAIRVVAAEYPSV